MALVAKQQLNRVDPERQVDLRLGLPRAEVQVVEVARDRLVERRHRGVDQEMMVAGIGPFRSPPAQHPC